LISISLCSCETSKSERRATEAQSDWADSANSTVKRHALVFVAEDCERAAEAQSDWADGINSMFKKRC